jgi:NAD(P)-dependent dehydrogenase (short-subunit alcohol dehydrogenase family)
MFPPEDAKTSDGLDMQFGTNVIGHFAFTQTVLPLMITASQNSPVGSVRMVWLSSSGVSEWRLWQQAFLIVLALWVHGRVRY